MRIGVTYDLRADYLAMGMSEEDSAEFDAEITIASLVDSLSGLGHEPVRIGNIRALTQRLAAGERWDAVFNICEGVSGYAREAQVPALLEAYAIPCVFSDALTMALSLDKAWTKRIVREAGVPTAPFAVIERQADIGAIALPFPLFLKPVAEGSGKGVSPRSRVETAAELKSVAAELLARFRQPVLVETYLPGREFTVGIVGTGDEARALGVLDIAPTDKAVGIDYGYENKERCDENIVYRLIDDAEARGAADVALAAWRVLRCRDGGRVDVRYDAAGYPQFIEVNPLAGLNPEHSDLCFLARFKGLTYQELIGMIMTSFLRRHPELASRRAAA
ncbi:MAG: D-alanine--D-alanine ligase [Hyphomicrobium sp.]|nr:D-alanine--D-alanine ligase [Hyphomicrobium sp.]